MTLRTPLYDEHMALGAKMMPFAGYDMPVRYAGDTQEHLAVRQRAGLFDVSHMGEFLVRGPKALELLQLVDSNDVSTLPIGKAQYGLLTNHTGGIVDDMIVYRLADDLYMIVANAANIAKDWAWISEANRSVGAELEDISEQTALIAVSGPAALDIVRGLTDADLGSLPYYGVVTCTFAGIERTVVATTGYTGEQTFELFFRAQHAVELWRMLLERGKPHGLEPAGLGARDTLRLEMGYMLYGNDINDQTSPLEAGLGWVTKLKKPDFIGRDQILAVKDAGLEKKLVGFRTEGRAIPRAGLTLTTADGRPLGRITSGGFSPLLKHGIGLGYVPVALSTPGTQIGVEIRGQIAPAIVTKPPFVQGTSLDRWK
jgi:aminomethyltransferase